MKDEKIRAELAKLDNYCNIQIDDDGTVYGYIMNNRSFDSEIKRLIPSYSDDYYATQQIIDNLSPSNTRAYIYHLQQVMTKDAIDNDGPDEIYIVKATPLQQCEALLKTFGRWQDEDLTKYDNSTEMAAQQFIGFIHATSGYNIESLARDMDLTEREWSLIKLHDGSLFTKNQIEEIDAYIQSKD